MFYNYRMMDVIILRNHLVLIYFWYYLEWILYFSIYFLSFSFKNKLRKVWWRCGEDIFRPFIRNRLTQGLVKMWWRCGEDIFRPFIRNRLTQGVVKIWCYVSKLFICSYCSISLLIIAFMLWIFLFEIVSVISL